MLYWLLLAPLILLRPPQLSGNVLSRYMTIEALAERGTLAIERSPLLARSGSPDVARFGRHLYSDKPPVLPALATPIDFGLTLAGVRFSGPIDQFIAANFVLTWLIVGGGSALALVGFRALLQGVVLSPALADLATVLLGVASPLLTYAVTFNNHSVAAGCVTAAWALTLLEQPGESGRRRFLAGFLAGLAAVIDLPVGCLTLAGVGLVALARGGRAALAVGLGASGPLLLHAGLQSLVTGSPLPVEMYPAAFEYPGSYWLTPEGQWHESEPRWRFGLAFLVGRQGALTVFPVAWFGLVGLIGAIVGRDRHQRQAAALVMGTLLILVGYYVWGVRRTDFAGSSFGCRHLLAIEPIVAVWAVVALTWLRPRGLALILLGGAVAVGGVYAVRGAAEPWSRVETRARTDPWLGFLQRLVVYRSGTFRGERPADPQPAPGALPR